MCDHKFIYGGIKYKDSTWPLPGTGAHERSYFDWFYCEKCTGDKLKELNFKSTTYEKPEFNATPLANSIN